NAVPGSLPAGRAVAWLSGWVWVIPFAALGFLFLLFPTGTLRSERWRPAAWFVGGGFALMLIGALVNAALIWSQPFTQSGDGPVVVGSILVFLTAALVISVTAVIVRFTTSSGDERLQLKWFAAAAALVVVTLFATMLSDSVVASVLSNLAFLG